MEDRNGVSHSVENDLLFRKVGVFTVAQPRAPNQTDRPSYKGERAYWALTVDQYDDRVNNRGT